MSDELQPSLLAATDAKPEPQLSLIEMLRRKYPSPEWAFMQEVAPRTGVCLDPFGGSGTVALVADRHHRNSILIDLDERNAPMAERRLMGDAPLFSQVTE